MRKFLTLPGLESDSSVVQFIASCYPDYAIPALLQLKYLEKSDIYGKCVSYFSTDFAVNIFSWGNYYRVTFYMRAEMHIGHLAPRIVLRLKKMELVDAF
jgi:hypothetical protein